MGSAAEQGGARPDVNLEVDVALTGPKTLSWDFLRATDPPPMVSTLGPSPAALARRRFRLRRDVDARKLRQHDFHILYSVAA